MTKQEKIKRNVGKKFFEVDCKILKDSVIVIKKKSLKRETLLLIGPIIIGGPFGCAVYK